MRYLIDTNIFVFMVSDKDSLDRDVYAILEDYDNVLYISIESIRELIVAYRNKGLLVKKWKTEEDMIRFIMDSNLIILPLKPEHMLTYSKMRLNEIQGHRDPSDHVIIAQAITEGITLISSDRRFAFYREQGLDFVPNIR